MNSFKQMNERERVRNKIDNVVTDVDGLVDSAVNLANPERENVKKAGDAIKLILGLVKTYVDVKDDK